MINYKPQPRQFNPNQYPAANTYRYPAIPNQSAQPQHNHHHHPLLVVVIIAAVIATILVISYTDIWKTGISQYNDGEELPPALPDEEGASSQITVDSGNDSPPPLPDFS